MRSRTHRTLMFGVVSAVGLSILSALPATADTATSGNSPKIFVIAAAGQSKEDAIANQAAASPTYRKSAQELAADWAGQLGKGATVPGLQGSTVSEQRTSLEELTGKLASGQAASASGSTAVAGTDGAGLTTSIVVPLVNGNSPNSFPVRGAPGSGNSYWTGMVLEVDGDFCSVAGCGPVTDKYTSNVTVNPGAVTSRINAQNVYWYKGTPSFGNKHFDIYAINRGSIVGTIETGNLGSSPQFFVKNNRALNGSVLTIAVALWVYGNPTGTYGDDGAKTHDCTCAASPDNSCRY